MKTTIISKSIIIYNIPKINLEKIGWNDEKGQKIKEKVTLSYFDYQSDVENVSDIAEEVKKIHDKVSDFLKESEPIIKSKV